MTVREFMHRWILGCVNKPLFYLPFHRSLGKVIIEPMSHIYDIKYDGRQFFAPYCNKSQLTGTIRIRRGKEFEPTLGCEYRIYKKVKKASGEYEYVSVLENGIIDRYEKAEMFKNKVELNLPAGTYYYKEFISGEGDILHFDIEKFEVKANEITNLIVDHEPKLVQTFFKFVKETEHFEIKKVSGGKPSPEGYGEYGDYTTSWGGSRLFPPNTTRRFTIGTTHSYSTEEYTFQLSPELDVHNAGLTQSIKESPNEKIIPEFTGVVYMGKDFSEPLHTQDVYNDTTRKVHFNLAQERYRGSTPGGETSYYDNYYMDFYEVSLMGHHKWNPDWYYDNILIHTGYLMLYHDYQIFNESASYHSLYINENYSQVSGSVQLTTRTYQGFYIKTPFLQQSRNNSLVQYFYYGYTPVQCEITEENKFADDSIYILEIKSPITETKVVKDTYKEDYLTDWAYNINIKQGYKNYYCEEHHKYETLYFIDENKYSKPYLVNTTETTKSYGGGTARGYAAAEDIGGASMWICKAVTASDPDTNGGYSPPYAAPGLGLYFTVTLYFNKDETYETVTQTYLDDLLFPMISPHVYKQKKKEYVYSKLNKYKDCVGACNCAVVFVRQTREHYKEWFKVEEPTDWEK